MSLLPRIFRKFKYHLFLLAGLFFFSIQSTVAQYQGVFKLIDASKVHYDFEIDDFVFDSIPIPLKSTNPTFEIKDGLITIRDSSDLVFLTNDEMETDNDGEIITYYWGECLQSDGTFQNIYFITEPNASLHVIMIINTETNEGMSYVIETKTEDTSLAHKKIIHQSSSESSACIVSYSSMNTSRL